MAISLSINGKLHHVTIARRRPHLVLMVDGEELEITDPPAIGDGHRTLSTGGRESTFSRAALGDTQWVRLGGQTFEVAIDDPFSRSAARGVAQDAIAAPMPGAVVSVHRHAGDSVTRGEPVVTIESMKLQTALPAPRDGVIADILCAEGATFDKGAVIVTLEPAPEGD